MRLACGCPDTVPDWNDRDVDLSHHAAHILPIPTLLHMPLSYGLYLQRQHHEIEQLELRENWPGLVLTQTGFFGGRIIALLESAQSPSRHVEVLPAAFRLRGKLHHGGIGTVRNSVRELQSQLLDAGRMPKELFLAHLTCPQCSNQRGGDRILVLRRWVESPRLNKRK